MAILTGILVLVKDRHARRRYGGFRQPGTEPGTRVLDTAHRRDGGARNERGSRVVRSGGTCRSGRVDHSQMAGPVARRARVPGGKPGRCRRHGGRVRSRHRGPGAGRTGPTGASPVRASLRGRVRVLCRGVPGEIR